MRHPYRDVPMDVPEQRVWLEVYKAVVEKHTLREDVSREWISREASREANRAAVAFRCAYGRP